MNTSSLILTNLISTWFLVGLIWIIQIVHYNLFDRVGKEAFVQYEIDHSRLITPVVGPPMLIELVSAVMLVAYAPAAIPRSWLVIGMVAVFLIWLSTAFIQVPCHERLSQGFSEADYRRLLQSNWIRTILWTFRGILMTVVAARMIQN